MILLKMKKIILKNKNILNNLIGLMKNEYTVNIS